MRAKILNTEVLYADEPIVRVRHQDMESLEKKAVRNERKRIRLCTHRSVDDRLHEMLIILSMGTYIRPHKHPDKSESFHVIKGSADIIIFNEAGDITELVQLGTYPSDRNFYYRISDCYYHTVLIRSKALVYHETTNGPFNISDTTFAPWAPEEGDRLAAKKFMEQMVRAAEKFLSIDR